MYEIFSKLLTIHNVSAYKVSKETGISQSTLSDWKRGVSTPKQDKLQKLAEYFGVSLNYLLTGDEEEEAPYYIDDRTTDIAQKILNNKELQLLFDAARDAAPEDLQTVHTMLLALKRKERGTFD